MAKTTEEKLREIAKAAKMVFFRERARLSGGMQTHLLLVECEYHMTERGADNACLRRSIRFARAVIKVCGEEVLRD